MKYTNQILEQYLHIYCNYQQNNWLDLLLLVEFVYNNTLSTTTRISLFFANKKYHPSISIHLEQDIASSYTQKFTINLNKLQDNLKTDLFVMQQQYQWLVNTYRTLVPKFQISQQVFCQNTVFLYHITLKKAIGEILRTLQDH